MTVAYLVFSHRYPDQVLRLLRTLREHLEILNACAARDGDAAEAALSRHFQAALQRILGMV